MRKPHQTTILITLCLIVGFNAPLLHAQSDADEFQRLAESIGVARSELGIPNVVLDYRENLSNLGDVLSLNAQTARLAPLQARLNAIDFHTLNACQRVEHGKLSFILARDLERADLGRRWLATEPGELGDGGLAAVALGDEWYRYLLRRWLGADVEPDDLFAFGEREIAAAKADYERVQAAMGFAGDREGLKAHLKEDQYFLDDDADILAGYRESQKIIWNNLSNQFHDHYGATPAGIVRSERGQSFPATGYYDRFQGEFHYNRLYDRYDANQMDWLLIHEASPGHHYQAEAIKQIQGCPSVLPTPTFYIYLEGWAAYTETLGHELGLFQQPAEALSAIDWNLVRSVRVAVDVGINAYGWTNEEALTYWRKHIPDNDVIANREINRMRNWPAQVITYKYGSDVFKRMKTRFADHFGPRYDVRNYHHLVLTHSDMPMQTFVWLVEQHLENTKASY